MTKTGKPIKKGAVAHHEGTGYRVSELVDERQAFMLADRGIVQLDTRKRVALGRIIQRGDGYKVYVNEQGQILLDPVVAVPTRQLWLDEHPEIRAEVMVGIEDMRAGRLVKGPDLDAIALDDDETEG